MAPTWLWWLPSSPVDSASCHILVAALARASTLPQRTASQLAMVRCPLGPALGGMETEEDWAQSLPSLCRTRKRNPE